MISANKFLPGASDQSGDHERDGRHPRTHAARNRIARAPAAGYQPVRPPLAIRDAGEQKEKKIVLMTIIILLLLQ